MHTDNEQQHRDGGGDAGGDDLRARIAGAARRLRAGLRRLLGRQPGRRRVDRGGESEEVADRQGSPPAARPGGATASAARDGDRLRVSGEGEEAYLESDRWEEVEP